MFYDYFMITFSQKYIEAIKQSAIICQEKKASQITARHIFLALSKTQGSLAFDILIQTKHHSTAKKPLITIKVNDFPEFNPEVEQLIQRSATIAYQKQHHYLQ